MAAEVDEVVGPRGKHDPERSSHRHGTEDGSVTLGGRRVKVERPRVRSADGSEEVRLRTYEHFADRDPLTALVLERIWPGSRCAAMSAPTSRSERRSTTRLLRPRSRRSRASSSSAPARRSPS